MALSVQEFLLHSIYFSRRFDSPIPCRAGLAVSVLFLRELVGFAVSFLALP